MSECFRTILGRVRRHGKVEEWGPLFENLRPTKKRYLHYVGAALPLQLLRSLVIGLLYARLLINCRTPTINYWGIPYGLLKRFAKTLFIS